MSEALTWQEFQQSELFSWFGVHEVGRTSDGHGRVAVRLEPGGNQEHIDLEVELDGNEIVRRATLLLDRAWVDQGQRINPFASDIAKGFLLAVAPGHTGARELAAHIEHIMSRNADIVGAGGPTPPSEPSPTVAAALNVYLGQGEHAELADAGAGVVVQNVTDAGRPRVRLEVTATGGAEAALDESGDQVARKPWWRFWQRG